jgi:hypothetical protein
MLLRSAFLGSTVVIVAFASSLEHLVDDADIAFRGATLEPISQCPATASLTFHHDGLQKDRRAEATFHFDPPRDGCYLVEERIQMDSIQFKHFRSKQCEASANTKVHVRYSKFMQAVGTMDQTPKEFQRQPEDQWNFIAALQFYAGHPGNVILSNEGTEPGTLTMFDQVRFSWSGKDCLETDAHPRRAEIQIFVDFQHVADRLTIFGVALTKRIADMAGVPGSSLRLTGLRSGSLMKNYNADMDPIIAEFLVLPSVVEDPLTPGLDVSSAKHSIEVLSTAVSRNTAELCALTGWSFTGCHVELNDLGFATPSLYGFKALPVPEQQTQHQQDEQSQQADGIDASNVIIIACSVFAAGLLLFAVCRLHMARSLKTKSLSPNPSVQSYEIKVQSCVQAVVVGQVVNASIEEGHHTDEKEVVDQDMDKSTVCPSIMSDKQSESSFCVDFENASSPEQGMSVVRAMSKGSRDIPRTPSCEAFL